MKSEEGERGHRFPEMLPGGKAVLFTAWFGRLDDASVAVKSLEPGEHRILVPGTDPHYVPTGHLVFAQAGSLLAVPFDLDRLEVTAAPVRVIEGLEVSGAGNARFTVSNDGTLVYVTGPSGDLLVSETNLMWVDRQGVARTLTATPGSYSEPRLSPDGRRLAMTVGGELSDFDIWVLDLARGTPTRLKLTFAEGNDSVPIWTPDGKHVTFSSDSSGVWNVFSVPADGSSEPVPLTASEYPTVASSWSRDGKFLAFQQTRPETGLDIGVLSMTEERETEIFLGTPFREFHPNFSPDGRWLAYGSDESGRAEVYVRAFPGPGGKWRISTEGGAHPLWAPNGRELFYRDGDKVMAVAVSARPEFSPGTPVLLFEEPYFRLPIGPSGNVLTYDVSGDGQRFVMVKPVEEQSEPRQVNVVLNWFEELKRLVPTEN